MVEATAFVALFLAYIWLLCRPAAWTILVLLAAVVGSFLAHRESLGSLGLSWRAFSNAMWEGRFALFAGSVVVTLVLGIRLAEGQIWESAGKYLIWCLLQQILLQNMVYRRLRETLGAGWAAWGSAGAQFGLVHWPNPVLVPATAVWGVVSCRLFEREGSVYVLALLQVLLSSALYELTPVEWHHGFLVGPGYWGKGPAF